MTPLTEREIREIIAHNVPPQYRSLAASFYQPLLDVLKRERLTIVREYEAPFSISPQETRFIERDKNK